ncbi:MAG: HesB/IscA family protein [Kiritimatiellia bacterium]
MTTTIDITERAQRELAKLEFGEQGFLRINVVPGGCSGMTYTAAVDTEFGTEDVAVFETESLRIVTDQGSAIFLEGLKIDFSDDLIRSGFRFTNPNASGSCGCGASFAG